MTLNTHLQEQLAALRTAADKRDWRSCETLMFDLYPHLSLEGGFRLAINQLAAHLETFERYHPDIGWVREWFAIIHTLEPADISQYNFPFHSETRLYNSSGSASPGSSAFMDGITLMQEAFEAYTTTGCDSGGCLNLVKGVIGSSITARTFAYAANTCPEAWEEARILLGDIRITDEYSLEELKERNWRRSAYDDCTNAFQAGLWHTLTDEIEALLT